MSEGKAPLTTQMVKYRVFKVVKRSTKVHQDELTLEANFVGDLGFDSLDTVETVSAMEEEFGMEFPDEVVKKTNDHSCCSPIRV